MYKACLNLPVLLEKLHKDDSSDSSWVSLSESLDKQTLRANIHLPFILPREGKGEYCIPVQIHSLGINTWQCPSPPPLPSEEKLSSEMQQGFDYQQLKYK